MHANKTQLISLEDIEKARRKEEEKVAKKLRYENRKSVDNLITQILSLGLFDKFSKDSGFLHPLPDNFRLGSSEYLEFWEPLYLYEVYNILMNSKRTNSDGKD